MFFVLVSSKTGRPITESLDTEPIQYDDESSDDWNAYEAQERDLRD